MSTFTTHTSCGTVTFAPLAPDQYPLVRDWVTAPTSTFWQMPHASLAEVTATYDDIARDPHHDAYVGSLHGAPLALVEVYDPQHAEWVRSPEALALYTPRTGDVGMHVLVAPTEAPVSGTTTAVFTAVMRLLFDGLGADRVVVEPDSRNTKIRAKNRAAGFLEHGDAQLGAKTATVSTCTAHAWWRQEMGGGCDATDAYLAPAVAERAHRELVAKLLREFAHERLLTPVRTDAGAWQVHTRCGATYTFGATLHPLLHWDIDPSSITCVGSDGSPADVTATRAVLDTRAETGLAGERLAVYLEEMSSTFAAACHAMSRPAPTAAALADSPSLDVESAMTQGHPGFVATNGRIGFSDTQFRAFAPECTGGVRPYWVAVAAAHSGTWVIDDPTLPDAVSDGVRAAWSERAAELGLDGSAYTLMPVHPWQWHHKITTALAPDVASRRIVLIGEDEDDYQPMQSLRTFANRHDRHAPYLKMALSIQNMGFTRGLSPAYMSVTPAINAFCHDVISADAVCATHGMTILREYATAGYTGDAFHESCETSYGTKLLAALWRENPTRDLGPGQSTATMAALLHTDSHDTTYVGALLERSGQTARDWFADYVRAYLVPLIHLASEYGMVFMPHGENVILRLDQGRVVGTYLKDIGEEAVCAPGVAHHPPVIPEHICRIAHPLTADDLRLSFLTDMVDGFLRHLAVLTDRSQILPCRAFWTLTAQVVADYIDAHPAAKALRLLDPTFPHSCLNRLQLRDPRDMVDLSNPTESLLFAGTLDNPLHDPARIPAE